jgi:hypothetical protein
MKTNLNPDLQGLADAIVTGILSNPMEALRLCYAGITSAIREADRLGYEPWKETVPAVMRELERFEAELTHQI